MERYQSGNYKIVRNITRHYSTSFSLGISLLPLKTRNAIYAIYAFVRYADEIVDTLYDYNPSKLLMNYRNQVNEALENKISHHPVLDAFQDTVHKYQIPYEYIDAFLYSMEMDLTAKEFTKKELDQYIYGSAEVVGLMCLYVFEPDKEKIKKLIEPARALGSAFQKVNFLRDVSSDYLERGRIYFPKEYYGNDFRSDECKKRFEAEIEADFALALTGIQQLPEVIKVGVYAAYLFYKKLFKKIQGQPAAELFKRRFRINNFQKSWVVSRCLVYDRFLL